MSNTTLNHGAATDAFLSKIDTETSVEIVKTIAKRYQITEAHALEEVTADEAEHLLDYLTGNVRAATSLLMKRHGFA